MERRVPIHSAHKRQRRQRRTECDRRNREGRMLVCDPERHQPLFHMEFHFSFFAALKFVGGRVLASMLAMISLPFGC